MKQRTDTYSEPELYQNDEKWVIFVSHLIQTEEEKAKQMKRIHDAAVSLVKDGMRRNSARKEQTI